MKFFWFISFLIISAPLFAQSELVKHQVTFGSDRTLAVNGTRGKGNVDSSVGTKDFDLTKGNFSVNYAYRFINNIQIGVSLTKYNSMEERKINASAGGGKIKSENNQDALYFFGTYNFQDQLQDSWFVTMAVGRENFKTQVKDTNSPAPSNSKTEYHVSGFNFEVGKRFSLKKYNIENLTYSPSISYKNGNAGGDLEDSGVDSLAQITFDLVKFDLLF